MGKTLRRTPDSKGVKTRNYDAVNAHMRNSGGPMGGTVKQKHKRDRSSTKRDLRAGAWA